MAKTLVDITAVMEVTPHIETKLQSLAPFAKGGKWESKGRIKHRLLAILGVAQLQVLLSNQRFGELIMLQATGAQICLLIQDFPQQICLLARDFLTSDYNHIILGKPCQCCGSLQHMNTLVYI